MVFRNASREQLFEIFEEHRTLNEIKFDFRDQPRPKSATLTAAVQRHLYAEEDTIVGASIPDKFDFELLKECSERLVPEKCRIYVCSKDFESECDMTGTVLVVATCPLGKDRYGAVSSVCSCSKIVEICFENGPGRLSIRSGQRRVNKGTEKVTVLSGFLKNLFEARSYWIELFEAFSALSK